MNNTNNVDHIYVDDNWLTTRELYQEIFKINDIKKYFNKQREKFKKLFNKPNPYPGKIDLSLKLPTSFTTKNYVFKKNQSKMDNIPKLKVKDQFKPVNHSGIQISLTQTFPSIMDSARKFHYISKKKNDNSPKVQKQNYKDKKLTFSNPNQLSENNIANIEQQISDRGKYMKFDPITRNIILNSEFKGENIETADSLTKQLGNSNLISNIDHLNTSNDVLVYGKNHGSVALISADRLEQKYPKEFREKAIPFTKTNSPFYKETSETREKRALAAFKALNIKKPEWSSSAIKSAQNKVARYLSYKALGLANYNFKFSKEEKNALSNLSKDNAHQLLSEAYNLADIATNKIYNQKAKAKNVIRNKKKTTTMQPIEGFYAIEGLDR